MKKVPLIKLYFIFLKIGAILLGGGYVILPIITEELSKKHNLISEDEIIDYFAISQSLPGIVAANISMFTGYKIRGKFGAITAMLGIITIPFITIVLLASILNVLSENIYFKGAMSGVEIAVIALIFLAVKEIWQKSETDLFFYIVFFLSLCCLMIFKFSPIQTIILAAITGIVYKKISDKGELK